MHLSNWDWTKCRDRKSQCSAYVTTPLTLRVKRTHGALCTHCLSHQTLLCCHMINSMLNQTLSRLKCSLTHTYSAHNYTLTVYTTMPTQCMWPPSHGPWYTWLPLHSAHNHILMAYTTTPTWHTQPCPHTIHNHTHIYTYAYAYPCVACLMTCLCDTHKYTDTYTYEFRYRFHVGTGMGWGNVTHGLPAMGTISYSQLPFHLD